MVIPSGVAQGGQRGRGWVPAAGQEDVQARRGATVDPVMP